MTLLEQQSIGRGIRTQNKILINSVFGVLGGGSSMEYQASVIFKCALKRYTRKMKLKEIFPEF